MSDEVKQMSDNLVVISFSATTLPENREVSSKEWVMFGEKDNYPDVCIGWFNSSSKHGAIVLGKSGYIAGKGFKSKNSTPQAENFIKAVNRYGESLDKFSKKVILDIGIHNGAYVQVIPKLGGGYEFYHIPFRKVRKGKDGGFFFKKDGKWGDNRRCKPQPFPEFDPREKRTGIICFEEYRPSVDDHYPLPEYISCSNYIEADIEVAQQVHSNAEGGFSASKMISLFNGEPDGPGKKRIEEGFHKKLTGSRGRKLVLQFLTDPTKKAQIDDLGSSDLTKEDFSHVDQIIQQNIYAGHRVTSPMLFGIKTEGQLGGRSELVDAYEIFKNTYVNERQQVIEEFINELARLNGVQDELTIVPTDPIAFMFTEQTLLSIAPKKWMLEKIGINEDDYKDSETIDEGEDVAQMGKEVNSILTNLSGRQLQQVLRIISKYKKGKIEQHEAEIFLKSGYGFSDEEVSKLLGLQQFSDDDLLYQLFTEVGDPISDYEIIKSKAVDFSTSEEAKKQEEKFYDKEYFAITQSEVNILDLINKDSRITPQVIAETLGVSEKWVINKLGSLENKGLIKITEVEENGSKVQVKELTQPLKDLTEKKKPETKEILIRYSYAGPQDSKNRPFCAKLLQLDRMYSRSQIELISEKVGYSVWERCGGFYTKPDGEVSPKCRHHWDVNIVTEKE